MDHPVSGSRAPKVWGKVLTAAVVALLLGLGGGLLLGLALFSPSEPEGRAEAHIQTGCQLVERMDDDDYLPFSRDVLERVEDPLLWEMTAAAMLFVAAGTADENYNHLQEAGMSLQIGMNTFRDEDVNDALDVLVRECRD
ncbi:hypothetical protein GCM10009771_00350 [Nesterenkonia flava]